MGEVVHERFVAAPPSLVFAMLAEPEMLVRWMGDSADLDPSPGGIFRFTLGEDACRGVYLEVDPPRRVVFTRGWERAAAIPVTAGSTTVEVDLYPEGDGTRLRLVHRGLEGDAALLHEHGWTRFLARLGAMLAGADPGTDPATETPLDVLARIRKEGPE